MIWSLILPLVGRIPGFLEAVGIWAAKRLGSKAVDTTQAQLQALIEERKAVREEKQSRTLSPWTAWMIPTAFGLSVFHYAAIVADSTLHLNLRVAKLPSPYDTLQLLIIISVVAVVLIGPTVRRILSK